MGDRFWLGPAIGAKPKPCRLSAEQQAEVRAWVREQLAKQTPEERSELQAALNKTVAFKARGVSDG